MIGKTNFDRVGEFMSTFGQTVRTKPTLPIKLPQVSRLRVELIEEELQEVRKALEDNDVIEVADALTDLLYVVYGSGHAFGIDLDQCFEEVHSSNMSKLGEDGQPIFREDGKVLKGPNYFKPMLQEVLFY